MGHENTWSLVSNVSGQKRQCGSIGFDPIELRIALLGNWSHSMRRRKRNVFWCLRTRGNVKNSRDRLQSRWFGRSGKDARCTNVKSALEFDRLRMVRIGSAFRMCPLRCGSMIVVAVSNVGEGVISCCPSKGAARRSASIL